MDQILESGKGKARRGWLHSDLLVQVCYRYEFEDPYYEFFCVQYHLESS